MSVINIRLSNDVIREVEDFAHMFLQDSRFLRSHFVSTDKTLY